MSGGMPARAMSTSAAASRSSGVVILLPPSTRRWASCAAAFSGAVSVMAGLRFGDCRLQALLDAPDVIVIASTTAQAFRQLSEVDAFLGDCEKIRRGCDQAGVGFHAPV